MNKKNSSSIVRPTAQHIVGVKRPPRPDFFDEYGSLHYEIAVPEDAEFILKWLLDNPFPPPTPRIGEFNKEEATEFFQKSIESRINSGANLMGFHGNDLVVLSFNVVETTPKDYTQLTKLPYNQIKEDYQQDIDNGPYKHVKCNMYSAFLSAMDDKIMFAFPPNSKVLVSRMIMTHKDYRRKGYANETVIIGMKYSKYVLGCEHALARLAVTTAVQMAKQITNLKTYRTINYADFRASGKPVFQEEDEVSTVIVSYKDLDMI